MIVFAYKGLNEQGVEISGQVEALDKDEALKKIQELKERGLQNLTIENATVSTKKCPQCAEEIRAEAVTCKHCGASFDEQLKAHKEDVEHKIDKYIKKGFLVQHRDEHRVQLAKPKKFSWFFFLLFFGIFYLIYYWQKKDKVVTLNL